MKPWLDDIREPWKHGCLGWTWAKTADQAIEYLKTGTVTEASLEWQRLGCQRKTKKLGTQIAAMVKKRGKEAVDAMWARIK